jgi:hypothetical protein
MNLKVMNNKKGTFLAKAQKVHNIHSESEMIETYLRLNNKSESSRFIYTLDDFGQACYTSMHSIDNFDLDKSDGYNLAGLEATSFDKNENKLCLKDEDGYDKYYLTNLDEFFIRKGNFAKGVAEVSMKDIIKKNIILNIDNFKFGNKDISKILDEEIYLLEVPVKNSYEAIMAFPNGYFNDDLSPYENYFLCQMLEEKFGYALFGIGASSLAFYRTKPLDKVLNKKLANKLSKIYRADEGSYCSVFEDVLNSQELLVLKYSDE